MSDQPQNTALNADSCDSQPIPAPKKKSYPPHRSRKPQAIKTAVIAKRASGQNKASISRDLGITVNCVTGILNESDIDRQLESGFLSCAALIPESVKVIQHRLSKNSENAAFKLLEGVGVLGTGRTTKQKNDQGLTLAIQNLMGNVTVNQPQAAEPEVSK